MDKEEQECEVDETIYGVEDGHEQMLPWVQVGSQSKGTLSELLVPCAEEAVGTSRRQAVSGVQCSGWHSVVWQGSRPAIGAFLEIAAVLGIVKQSCQIMARHPSHP